MLISNHKYVYFVKFYYCFLSMLPEWRIKFNITFSFSLRAWDPVDYPRHYGLPDPVG